MLYGPIVRLIMCIVGVYSKEEEVKDYGRRSAAWLKRFSGKKIIPPILQTDRRLNRSRNVCGNKIGKYLLNNNW